MGGKREGMEEGRGRERERGGERGREGKDLQGLVDTPHVRNPEKYPALCLAVSSMHVELEESSYDERVVAEFVALLHRSSPHHRHRLLNAVHQAAARLHQCGVELLAATPSGSVMLYFALESLSAVHEMDLLYHTEELTAILEDIFTCLLESSQVIHIKAVAWSVTDFNNCVQYFLQGLGEKMHC